MHELLLAARTGDIEKVKVCLARGDNIEMQEGNSGTPLFCAAAENHLEVVKLLLNRGARVRTANLYYWNALHVAVQKHHNAIVDELMKYLKFCDICKSLPATPRKRYGPFPGYGDHRDPKHVPRADTAIHIAAKCGNLYGLKQLLKRHPKQINFYGAYGYTPLMYAVASGHVAIVRWLIEQMANLELTNDEGQTVFKIALQGSNVDIVELLFYTKDNNILTATNKYGDTLFHSIAWMGNLNLLQNFLHKYVNGYLLDGAFGNKLWFTALDRNHFTILHFLIKKYGNKVLFQPSSNNGLLIQMAVHSYAFENNSAKQSAWQYLIQLMLEKNSQLTIFIGLWKWRDIQTRLIERQNLFAEFLLKTIDHNLYYKTFKANASLLHVAVESNSLNAMQGLMKYIKNMNSQDEKGNTPIHYAAHNVNLFHYLRLTTDADITLSNNRGLTPLKIAKTQVNNYEIQAEQFNQAFQAANLIYRLLNKARRWQIINQAKTKFEFFNLPMDLQRIILFIDENVSLSLISDEQIQKVIEYGQQRETLNLHYPNTASNKIQFLQRIGTNIKYGFFTAGQFIPPKEETTLQIKNC